MWLTEEEDEVWVGEVGGSRGCILTLVEFLLDFLSDLMLIVLSLSLSCFVQTPPILILLSIIIIVKGVLGFWGFGVLGLTVLEMS